ncbi:MAG: iron chaperone [Acidimicrobiia bacterium]
MTTSEKEVDDLLAILPEQVRDALQQLREVIRAAAPGATERIGYGVPAFYYKNRPLVSYGAGKNHCSFYVQSPAVIESYQNELGGYDTAKGTVRFSADRPLPAALVEKLVRARMAETDSAG